MSSTLRSRKRHMDRDERSVPRSEKVRRLATEIKGHAWQLLGEQLQQDEVFALLDEAYRIADVPYNAAVAAR